jgi:hypothetical protein
MFLYFFLAIRFFSCTRFYFLGYKVTVVVASFLQVLASVFLALSPSTRLALWVARSRQSQPSFLQVLFLLAQQDHFNYS